MGCFLQMFIMNTFLPMESSTFLVMAYDRYVAVCIPLRYLTIMSPRFCLHMVAGCWIGGSISSFIHTVYPMHFPICGSREIHHFFCEVPVLIKLSCEDTSVYQLVVVVTSIVLLVVPFSLIIASYTLIFLTVLRMNSVKGRKKALATCSSHLTAVLLFYCSAFLRHIVPTLGSPQELIFSVQYSVITPLMNPLIYSLKNNEVKAAMQRTFRKYLHC